MENNQILPYIFFLPFLLRERLVIFYDPATRQPIEYLRSSYRHYTPDFLIRHKTTGKTFLVEIKPHGFEGHPQLDLRKEVAEKYIRWKNYDWTYKAVFDDEIILNAEQLEDFKECYRLKSSAAFKLWFEQNNRKLNRGASSFFTNAAPEARIRYIMFGNAEQFGGWHQ